MTTEDRWPKTPGSGSATGPRPVGGPKQEPGGAGRGAGPVSEVAADADTAGTLEAFFEAARQSAEPPGEAFLTRLVQDALDEQDRQRAARGRQEAGRNRAAPHRSRLQGWLAAATTAIGGLPGTGVLAASTILGLWVGYTDPSGLVTQALSGVGLQSTQAQQDESDGSDMLTDLYLYSGEG